jgi:hypothetical protein
MSREWNAALALIHVVLAGRTHLQWVERGCAGSRGRVSSFGYACGWVGAFYSCCLVWMGVKGRGVVRLVYLFFFSLSRGWRCWGLRRIQV